LTDNERQRRFQMSLRVGLFLSLGSNTASTYRIDFLTCLFIWNLKFQYFLPATLLGDANIYEIHMRRPSSAEANPIYSIICVAYCFFASLAAFLSARFRISSCMLLLILTTIGALSPRNLDKNQSINP
jgi:hypothetical protein